MPTTNIANGSSNPSNPECIQSGRAASLERARYFARQLLTADDLTADQQHVLARFRRHNRLLHGWGVVCGAGVRAVPAKEWTVVVEPGYLLGPQGDEILIDICIDVDLSRQGLDGNAAGACVDPVDPWCSSVRVDRRVGQRCSSPRPMPSAPRGPSACSRPGAAATTPAASTRGSATDSSSASSRACPTATPTWLRRSIPASAPWGACACPTA